MMSRLGSDVYLVDLHRRVGRSRHRRPIHLRLGPRWWVQVPLRSELGARRDSEWGWRGSSLLIGRCTCCRNRET